MSSQGGYFTLAVVLFSLSCQVDRLVLATNFDSDSLAQVCCPKTEPLGFTSPKQVNDLIEIFKSHKSWCPNEDYHGAFESLSHVLDNEILADVCSQVAYDRIRAFHTRYISIYTPEATKEDLEEAKKKGASALEPIPESLRIFFILFSLQINAQCKRNLVDRLNSDTDKLLTEEDFNLMEQMKSEASRLLGEEYREQAKKMEDLVILSSDAADYSKLHIQVQFGDVIKKAKDACDNKFRPIYEELYVPVIRLNNLGYKDKLNTEKENEDLILDKKLTRWFSIIETCEILKDIDVIQDSSSLAAVADLIKENSLVHIGMKNAPKPKAEMNSITLLSEEEANELKARIARNIELHESVSVYEPKRLELEHQKLAFTPRMWLLEYHQRKQEVKNFERRTRKFISKKTSYFHLQLKALSLSLKKKFHKYKLQLKNRDETSALGKIASFMHRHQAGIRLACAIIGLVIIISVHFG